jgi:hypothetical protein
LETVSTVYVDSKFLGEMVRELLLAFAGMKHGTMTAAEALGVYDYWLERLANEINMDVSDDPALVKPGNN